MYSYNRIHNDYDTNVVRVELNSSSYRPHSSAVISRATSREPLKITSSTTAVNRSDTFTKHDRQKTPASTYHHHHPHNNNNNNNNSGIVRSETFIVKHHDDSSDEQKAKQRAGEGGYDNDGGDEYEEYEKPQHQPDYGTYTRSKKKSANNHNGTSEGKYEKDDKSNYDTYTRREKRGNEMIFLRNEIFFMCR